ncbi:MAG: TonB-dependent receptor plug domain-containing protein [Pseudomonadales bacterium]
MPGISFAAEGDEAIIEEVVVTGSRIKKSNVVSLSPVTQVDAEELILTGTVRVEDLMRNLPQVYSNQNSSQSNGATGTATLNLRNLGDERTLVLVNGRRLPAGSPLSGGIGADINQIPGGLIETVEVLTGGASATYGSDAVAGVVNFKMKNDFEGIQIDAQFSQYQHGNDDSSVQRIVRDGGFPVADGSETGGDISNFSIIIGGNLDNGRGNVTAYATYRDVEAVLQSERDYSSCALSTDATFCFGSGTIPDGRVTNFLPGTNPASFDFKVAGNEFVPRDGTVYNYGPLNYFQRPDERYTAGAFANYQVTDQVEAYAELMFMDNQSVSQIAPSGAFFVTNTLPCSNPLLSAQQLQALCTDFGLGAGDIQTAYLGRRNVEGGPRQQDLRHTSFRGVFGVRGDINEAWSYDLFGQYSEVSMENTYLNDLSTTNITRALNAVTDPVTGETVCQSVVDGSDPTCVPWNIFTTGAVTQDQIDYLVLPLFARGTTDQKVFSGYIAGSLGEYGIKLPGADNGIDVVFGAEYRSENLNFNPDSGFRSGDGAGQGGATGPVSGGFDVKEFFVEASIPVIEGAAFAEELTLDLGYRYSDYSTDQTTDTYGIRAGWAINNDVKVRASYQRAVRAANIQELFLPQGFNLFDMDVDPCGGVLDGNGLTAAGRSFEECARSGVTAAQFGNIPDSPAGQYNFLQGGNPSLAPEEADTYTFGVIYQPGFVDDLTISLDYYDIEIKEGISNLTPEFILNECLDGNTSQCAQVNRGGVGDLWIGSDVNNSGNIVALQDNLAIERVKGFDLVVDYSMELGDLGTLSFRNIAALIDTWDQQELAGAPAVDCVGNWGATCGYPTPEFQNNLRATWVTPWSVTLSGAWRFIDEIEDLGGAGVDLDSVHYFDLAGYWDINEYATITLGMNNVLDEAPPIAGNAAGPSINGNGNIFPGMYDHLGRYWFGRATFTF